MWRPALSLSQPVVITTACRSRIAEPSTPLARLLDKERFAVERPRSPRLPVSWMDWVGELRARCRRPSSGCALAARACWPKLAMNGGCRSQNRGRTAVREKMVPMIGRPWTMSSLRRVRPEIENSASK